MQDFARRRGREYLAALAVGGVAGGAIALTPGVASAHRGPLSPAEVDLLAWDVASPVLPLVLVVAALYGVGVTRLWSRAGMGRGVSRLAAAWFATALFVLLVALVSPLDGVAASLFAAHMGQHLALTVIVAPLLMLGRPDHVLLWALPPSARYRVGRGLGVARQSRAARTAANPAVVVVTYSLVLWLWHVPPLYEAVERNVVLHTLEHASLLGFASLFWWRVLDLLHRPPRIQIRALPFIFMFMLVSLTLGAVLTFSNRAWFTAHEATAPAWGLSPLEDQQLGGLLMLMPATFVHLGALLLVFARVYAGSRDLPRTA